MTDEREEYTFLEEDFLESILKKYADKELFIFYEGEELKEKLTGRLLEEKILSFTGELNKYLRPQEKVVLLLRQGLEFICSLLGAYYANVIAIPIGANKICDKASLDEAIIPILEDSQAKCIIANTTFINFMKEDSTYQEYQIIDAEEIYHNTKGKGRRRKHDLDDICTLLYTSGSSSRPKGVNITHQNMLFNSYCGVKYCGMTEDSVIVNWIPQFHAFGLMYDGLAPLMVGAATILFSPEEFITNPKLWFQLIDKYKATHTAGSNFAYDYCVSAIEKKEVEEYSLETIKGIFSGGEPVRIKTVQDFSEKFKSLGIHENVFSPLYGMSECGVVSALSYEEPMNTLYLDIPSFIQGKIQLSESKENTKAVVSCGRLMDINELIAVNLETMSLCKADEIGEIWMRGPSVAPGYHDRPEETKRNFNYTIDGKDGFYRTGDLGFIRDGHIFVIGREKEVIIIHGKNYYQVDLEWTIQNHLPELTLPICVFSCDKDEEERVYVAVEAEAEETKESLDRIAKEITVCISEQYAISVYEILFVTPKSIPKTASGKIQRKKCSILYTKDKLEKVYVVRECERESENEIKIKTEVEKKAIQLEQDMEQKSQKMEQQELQINIGKRIREEVLQPICNASMEKVQKVEKISELGLNSIQFIQAAKKMTDTFHVKCEPVLLFKYKTVSELAEHIYENLSDEYIAEAEESIIKEARGKNTGETLTTMLQDGAKEEFNSFEEKGIEGIADTDVAVIGMSCSFPGESVNPRAYWKNLIEGNDCITEIDKKHLRLLEDYQKSYGDTKTKMAQWGGFIEDQDCFDAPFFGISKLEAESMDPQQRKAMELAWKTMEDAGYNPKEFAGTNTGVFLGAHGNDYLELIAKTPNIMDTYGAYLDTGANMTILPNRISRWFDFHGPSEVYNTACSSSLTAIHHAIEAVQSGRCEMALAGGVNLILSTRCYAAGSKAGMLSEDGRCKTLDESANGFVRSEGIGAILLKPYRKAVEDRDNIYGILKGSAINHDGQSNSLRAPNLNGQKDLIVSAYQKANIPIETITNIEMHGTGTELGDPIEFQALKDAFEELGARGKQAYCGLSSIKTIIGHCEAASGIASVIKVLLSMKEKKFPGNLHFKHMNPYINMENTPFYHIDKSCQWKALVDENGNEIPRRAGVSSFGIGGSNAHVVLEECIQKTPRKGDTGQKVIVPFSAKTKESLLDTIKEFVSFFESVEQEQIGLQDLAYTMQIGRCPMEVRKAFIVHNIEELKEVLIGFLESPVRMEHDVKIQLKELDDLENTAKYWENGGTVNWKLLYTNRKGELPRRLHLPTYAFRKNSYWLVSGENANTGQEKDMVEVLHPLIEKNTSDFFEQKFINHITKEKFYVKDHTVEETCILPGVITIEMARAAYVQSNSDIDLEKEQIEIRDLVWSKSIAIENDPVEIGMSLYPESDTEVAFELYLTSDEIVCSEGRIEKVSRKEMQIDLDEIAKRCKKSVVVGSQFYEQFKTFGMEYGNTFRGVKEIQIGTDEALAKLCIPSEVEGTLESYMMHPSMLDASLQACSSLFEQAEQTLILPYKINRILISAQCTNEMWAYVKKEHSSNQAYSIDLCDSTGKVCVSFRDVQFIQSLYKSFSMKQKTLMFEKTWREQELDREKELLEVDKKVLILVEPSNEMVAMTNQFMDYEYIILDAKGDSLKEQYKSNALRLFHELKKIMAVANEKSILIQLLHVEKDERYLYGGLEAMLKTAAEENGAIQSQVIVLRDWDTISAENVKAEACVGGSSFVRYADGKRYVSDWKQIAQVAKESTSTFINQNPMKNVVKPCWKDGGVYLITGGLGGIGLEIVREIQKQVQDSVLILTGRSSWDTIDAAIKEELDGLENTTIDYVQADVSERKDTTYLIQLIMEKYHTLTGVIHTAGVIQDNYIVKKTEPEFLQVMKAKVDGIANLDQASAKLPIEFFCVFSSIAGCFGNVGQVDYAAANAFMDEYVRYRNQLEEKGLRFGHALSINWPLWEAGGMYVDETTRHVMKERMGLHAMPSSCGMDMLYQALAEKNTNVMVMHGEGNRIHNYIKRKTLEHRRQVRTAQIEKDISKQAVSYFKNMLSSVLRTPAEQLNENQNMDDYGIDSIIIMQLNEQLESEFGRVSKTLFFEYHTICEIAEYFVKHYQDVLLEKMKTGKTSEVSTIPVNTTSQNKVSSSNQKENKDSLKSQSYRQKRKANRRRMSGEGTYQSAFKEDIAIIGLAGHYAGADNVDEFWENLCAGKDCITEIPKERWDYSDNFSTDKNAEGKTYSKWGGFLKDIEYFDPLFFHISPREAEKMDPQERLFLQCVEETLEDAGYTKTQLEQYQYGSERGKVGVFVGAMFQEYQMYGNQMTMLGKPDGVYGTLSQIANRISYFYNLHGPSMSVDTMCSSSLTAIHLACESIHNGQCGLAIAGGVNVTVHPNKYIVLSQGKFASTDGKCRAFGAHGDGYVPGEGVGALLLKPVSKAIADGDHIYGVIKGSAINHGGKVSSITVPNPNAQAEVIQAALKDANIHPRTIQYVETHGTGTILGDPIEITGLTKAYEPYTTEVQFCKIGSVKSNIGHCESAAGIASLTKVLLQMKYKKFVPSLHCEEENPNIDFTKTPFAIQKTLEDWNPVAIEVDGIQKVYPRRAAISAFGAGGSNAHILIEEYNHAAVEEVEHRVDKENPAIILLTAKNQEQLHNVAKDMLQFIQTKVEERDLYRIAYTLQTGRNFYEQRLAMSVSSLVEMQELLEDYLSGKMSDQIEIGTTKETKLVSSLFEEDEDIDYIIESWIAKKKYKKLLHLWVMGLEFDWNKLYLEERIEKVSLPTYPFAKVRYWFPDKLKELEKNAVNVIGHGTFISPLLHRNTSNLDMQRFSSIFTGNEFFLRDHLVNQRKVFSSAAYMEMIRKACVESVDGARENGICLRNVVYNRSLSLEEESKTVHIGLWREGNGLICYDIYDNHSSFCQGSSFVEVEEKSSVKVDIEQLHAECVGDTLSREDCYCYFEKCGIVYGEEHKGIQSIYKGNQKVLAKLHIPNYSKEYFVHPGILDSAIQSSMGLFAEKKESTLILPYSVETVEFYEATKPEMWALVELVAEGNDEKKVNIDLYDKEGNLSVRLHNLCFRDVKKTVRVSKETKFAEAKQVKGNAQKEDSIEEDQIKVQLEAYLIKICSEVIHLPQGKMEPEELFGNYGLDSVMIMQITDVLERDFGTLSKTLFFEYLTVRELAQFFMRTYSDKVRTMFAAEKVEIEKASVVEEKSLETTEEYKINTCRNRGRKPEELQQAQHNRSEYIYQNRVKNIKSNKKEDIAIIGLAGHYAQADNMEELWKNISEGKDCIIEVPLERWDHSKFYDPKVKTKRKTYTKWGGFLNDIEYFDPLFFNISPSKAETMEPQEKLFLQCVEETIEDAGYSHETLSAYEYGVEKGKIGVFVGAMYQEYQLYGVEAYERGHDKILVGMSSCIANRVSYYYNLHGPSIVMDTMCSSALTALHMACESIHNGDCGMAIVGGVNVSIHPNKYLMLAQDKFASTHGRCKAFGADGNGYVPGEGIGAILIKPLSKAEEDGDHIYGVIKATSINHGGKTNGFTVPNPTAQCETIKEALRSANMNPESIGYIEAHGTGTELGDPIEITGLSNAFGAFTERKQFCKIGSIKSNIGHCESASGMASISKVLLQMKYGKLVPSIHSEELNPNINFEQTPFIVQHQLEDWNREITLENGVPVEVPRRAGISAFGAGGSNACVLIEEYIEPKKDANMQNGIQLAEGEPAIILLSAMSKNQLREVALRLLSFIEKNVAEKKLVEQDIYGIAYTLQTGRTFFEERLAVMVTSMQDLLEKLGEYIDGKEGEYYLTNKHNKAKLTAFKEKHKQPEQKVEEWFYKKEFEKVLNLWVAGFTVPWTHFYQGQVRKKMSLPTYPFAKERCWFPDCLELLEPDSVGGHRTQAVIHPLLHKNVSTLYEERFTSTWSGTEEFLRDHVINGKKVLPGAAYLELARKACIEAMPELEKTNLCISDVIWKRAFAMTDERRTLDIRIDVLERDKVVFEMFHEKDTYCQGTLNVLRIEPKNQVIDIEAIKQECQEAQLTGEQCYHKFAEKGLIYGDTHRGIVGIHCGKERTLTELHVKPQKQEYYISPGMLDSAIQSVIGLSAAEDREQVLPYSLGSIDILRPTSEHMWAVTEKKSATGNMVDAGTKKVDIYLYTEEGELALYLKDLVFKVIKKESKKCDTGILFYPEWQIKKQENEDWIEDKKRLIVLCETPYNMLEDDESETEYLILQSEEESLASRYEQYAQQLYEQIKSILELHLEKTLLVQLVLHYETEQLVFRGLAGLLKSARMENPNLYYQVIEMEEDISDEMMYLLLDTESCQKEDKEIRYISSVRYVKTLREEIVEKSCISNEDCLPWKENGVYWITGGMGGLGYLFAEETARQLQNVTLILTGRRNQDEAITQEMNRLEKLGATIQYRSVDISDRQSVEDFVFWIKEKYGVLHGILHCAGITRDNFILHKTVEEFNSVIKPKVSGTYYIDQITRDMELDFIVFFSSQSGEEGNVGQADYATGNAFMDAYAEYRNRQVEEGTRFGKTVSINWPLWKDGGMHLSKEMEDRMYSQRGIIPLQRNMGLHVFYKAMESNTNQLMVIQGDVDRISKRKDFEKESTPVLQSERKEEIGGTTGNSMVSHVLQDKTEWYLKDIVSKIIKLPVERIKSTDTLDRYGIDSIIIMDMTDELELTFGTLSKTLFFEYQTIKELANYFIEHYEEVLVEKFDCRVQIEEREKLIISQAENKQKETTVSMKQVRKLKPNVSQSSYSKEEPIAIIGVAGKYPQAENIEQFWENLCGGKDCITEIPKERWNLEEYCGKQTAEKLKCKYGGFIEDVDKFDPLFFRISPQEAKGLDPQEKLFLQCAYETLEDAGYTPEALKVYTGAGMEENIGVFAGVMYTDYQLYGAQAQMNGDMLAVNGISSGVANRVSYTFNFHGPSMTVNTMCSSSLLAVHLACQSIRNGECEMALAGGINVTIHPSKYLLLAHKDFTSANGRCSAFGKNADGYVPGEGMGAILLKPLSKAIEDNDQIYAVVKGSSVNHGGKTNGYTVPNPSAQTDVIQRALKFAGVNAEDISYIEAHGTGTALGDPIEVNALTKAFSKDTDKKQYCAIGSVKSNIGHLESAAGIASITKVLLQMKYKKLVPSIHTEEKNPNIVFEQTPFYVQQKLEDWDTGKALRRAGISAFGAGGTNVHLILEEYPQEEVQDIGNPKEPYIIILSGRDAAALKGRVSRLYHAIQKGIYREEDLQRIAYTLQVGREGLEHRFAALVMNLKELQEKLSNYLADVQNIENVYSGTVKEGQTTLSLFAADEDLKDAVSSWIEKRKYSKLLNFWVKGLDVAWNEFYTDMKPRKISLPTYPFAKERMWMSELEKLGDENGVWIVNPSKTVLKNLPVSVMEQKAEKQVKTRITLDENITAQKESIQKQKKDTTVSLKEQTTCYVKQLFSNISEIPAEQIDEETAFEEYGMDSIMIKKLSQELQREIGEIPVTVFFDCQDLKSLVDYLLKKQLEGLEMYFGESLGVELSETYSKADSSESISSKEKLQSKDTESCNKNVTEKQSEYETDDIAIIGMSGRYPGANNVNEFWENLKAGKDSITEIPLERWDYRKYYDREKGKKGSLYGKWGGFIEGADQYDPLFFNTSPDRAEIADPNERLFLQSVYETLEDAGYTKESLSKYQNLGLEGDVGVFVGVTFMEYQFYGVENQVKGKNIATPGIASGIANNVSYFFNFHGPSIAVDTMCSSSLTALHLACESIKHGDCQLAVAGGVNLSLHPNKYLFLSENYFLSSKGRCESFGKGGDGYVPGEGVVSVLLKPLAQAEQDGDHIYGVIKASAINHGGKTNGYTVPNLQAQRSVIQKAIQESQIHPRAISYMEAHGTGTSLGDPVEIDGLTSAYREYTEECGYCSIGSVKSNIGHLEAASGLAGLTKILLQMKYKTLVPSIHSKELNENLHLERTPFYVQHALEEWKRPVIELEGTMTEFPRIAGLSSFGAGGANAHVIIEEYCSEHQETKNNIDSEHPAVIILSAKTESALHKIAEHLVNDIDAHKESYQEEVLSALAYTLQVGREAMNVRLGFLVASMEELKQKLAMYLQGKDIPDTYVSYVSKRKQPSMLERQEKRLIIEDCLQQKRYSILLELWSAGYQIDWEKLYALEEKPKRMSLPTYPFETMHCWLAEYEQKRERKDSAKEMAQEVVEEKMGLFTLKLSQLIAEDMKIGVNQLDPYEELGAYGFDSIKAMTLVQQLKPYFGEIPASIFVDSVTIDQLSRSLQTEYPESCKQWILEEEK